MTLMTSDSICVCVCVGGGGGANMKIPFSQKLLIIFKKVGGIFD